MTAFRLPRENITVREVPNHCKYETGKWRRERVDAAYATFALKSVQRWGAAAGQEAREGGE